MTGLTTLTGYFGVPFSIGGTLCPAFRAAQGMISDMTERLTIIVINNGWKFTVYNSNCRGSPMMAVSEENSMIVPIVIYMAREVQAPGTTVSEDQWITDHLGKRSNLNER